MADTAPLLSLLRSSRRPRRQKHRFSQIFLLTSGYFLASLIYLTQLNKDFIALRKALSIDVSKGVSAFFIILILLLGIYCLFMIQYDLS